MKKTAFLFALLLVLSACGAEKTESSSEIPEESSAVTVSEESASFDASAYDKTDVVEKAFEPSEDGVLKAGKISFKVPKGFEVKKEETGTVELLDPDKIVWIGITYIPIFPDLFEKTPEEMADSALNDSVSSRVLTGYTADEMVTTLANPGLVIKSRIVEHNDGKDTVILCYANNEEDQISISFLVNNIRLADAGMTLEEARNPYDELISSLKSEGGYTLPDADSKVGEHPPADTGSDGDAFSQTAPGEFNAGEITMNYPEAFKFAKTSPMTATLMNNPEGQMFALSHMPFAGGDAKAQAENTINMNVKLMENDGYEKLGELREIEREGYTILRQDLQNIPVNKFVMLIDIISEKNEVTVKYFIDTLVSKQLGLTTDDEIAPIKMLLNSLN